MTNATPPHTPSFLRDERGSGFVEKILIIALFAFVVTAGLRAVSNGSNDKLQEHGAELSGVRGTIR